MNAPGMYTVNFAHTSPEPDGNPTMPRDTVTDHFAGKIIGFFRRET